MSPTPSPYATANLLMKEVNNNHLMAETIYTKPESISYYASSQLAKVYGVEMGLSTPPAVPRIQHSIHTNRSNGSVISHGHRREQKIINTNTGTGSETKDKWRQLEVSPEEIDCLQMVREGTYGRVYSGTLRLKEGVYESASEVNSNGNEEERKVLIKTVLGKWETLL